MPEYATDQEPKKPVFPLDRKIMVLHSLAQRLADTPAVTDGETFQIAAQRRVMAIGDSYKTNGIPAPRAVLVGKRLPVGIDAVIYPLDSPDYRDEILEFNVPDSGRDDIMQGHPLYKIKGAGVGWAARHAYVALLGTKSATTMEDLAVAQLCCIAIGQVNEVEADATTKFLRKEWTKALIVTVGHKHWETAMHMYRVGLMAMEIACARGYTMHDAKEIALGATLHDVGKFCISEKLLKKTTPLTDEERLTIQEHAAAGMKMMIASRPFYMEHAAIIAGNHHEKVDGTGYPNRRAGDEVPEIANITAAADVIDAIATKRAYRNDTGLGYVAGLEAVCCGTRDRRTLPSHFHQRVLDAVRHVRGSLVDIGQANPDEPIDEDPKNAPKDVMHMAVPMALLNFLN